jgi:threonine 3-dehydrogenase
MKALVKEKPEPGLWLEEQPIPEIGRNNALPGLRRAKRRRP